MRVLILTLPCLMVLIAIMALVIIYASASKEQSLPVVRRAFIKMSYALGLAILIWAGAVIASNMVQVAYPVILGVVGLLFILQGLAFARFKIL